LILLNCNTYKMNLACNRIAAFVIDHIILFGVLGIYARVFGTAICDLTDNSTYYRLTDIGKLFSFVIFMLYFPVLNTLFYTTIGRKICNLRINFVTDKSILSRFTICFFRNLFSILEFTLTIGILPSLALFFTGTRLVDKVTKTDIVPYSVR
jgi:uncharacterized RDD family membrane protein YckC